MKQIGEKKDKVGGLLDYNKASGCWITKKRPRPCNILEQFTYTSFTSARQIKLARPLGLHYIARPVGLHYNYYVSLARPLGLYYKLAQPLGLHYNHYASLSILPSVVS